MHGNGQDAEVVISGIVHHDMGGRIVARDVTLTGNLNMRIRYPHVKEEAGWHYSGTTNRARDAIGEI